MHSDNITRTKAFQSDNTHFNFESLYSLFYIPTPINTSQLAYTEEVEDLSWSFLEYCDLLIHHFCKFRSLYVVPVISVSVVCMGS